MIIVFCNFGFAEVTALGIKKNKFFILPSFFRNFASDKSIKL